MISTISQTALDGIGPLALARQLRDPSPKSIGVRTHVFGIIPLLDALSDRLGNGLSSDRGSARGLGRPAAVAFTLAFLRLTHAYAGLSFARSQLGKVLDALGAKKAYLRNASPHTIQDLLWVSSFLKGKQSHSPQAVSSMFRSSCGQRKRRALPPT